jgi:hypothetical protein
MEKALTFENFRLLAVQENPAYYTFFAFVDLETYLLTS